jgi:spore coat protein U-like protein
MNNKIITACAILATSLALSQSVQAGSSLANPKATAVIASSCQISAQNLAFGNLVLPVSAQTASSNMTVLCSKNAPYTVGLAYGGVYGTGASGNYWMVMSYMNNGSLICQPYKVIYEYNSSGTIINSGCQNNFPSGTTYDSSNGHYNVGTVYNYGKMFGVAKGDSIGYSIAVPNNPSQVWNTGNYTYAGTGTGASQTLPIKGTLVPAQSSSNYPSPDSYIDTVTATVNF